jgi:hypothetical protein
MLLKHGFAMASITIVLGFAYGVFRYQNAQQGVITQQTDACGSNIVGDNNKANVNCGDKAAPKAK